MSNNIGKQPVTIKEGTTITVSGGKMVAVGPKGTLEEKLPGGVKIEIVDGQAKIVNTGVLEDGDKFTGLARALLANMVTGVTEGFTKKLELSGVGYRAQVQGQDLVLNVGYAVPVKITPPPGITFQAAEGIITVSGINKQLIGDVASKVRGVRIPDPYKAKGIKYEGERIRRKVGKAAKAVGATK